MLDPRILVYGVLGLCIGIPLLIAGQHAGYHTYEEMHDRKKHNVVISIICAVVMGVVGMICFPITFYWHEELVQRINANYYD